MNLQREKSVRGQRNDFMNKPPIYVINLARALDRRESILDELRLVNVAQPCLIPAYDGHAVDFPFQHYQHLAGLFWGDPARFKPGAFACYLSHAACWRAIAEGQEPFGLVLEDDIAIHTQPFNEFPWTALPDGFDLIFVNAGMKHWHQLLLQQTKLGADVGQDPERFTAVSPLLRQLIVTRVFKGAIAGPGAYGYLVSRSGAAKLLAMMHSRKICMGVDYAMVFQSLSPSDREAIQSVGLPNLPKSLRFFLPKEEAQLLANDAIVLHSYVYTSACLVSCKRFPSMIRHAVYLDNRQFYQ
jgi:GR25 family glycosyltransferase involved in LPS biosynthesis